MTYFLTRSALAECKRRGTAAWDLWHTLDSRCNLPVVPLAPGVELGLDCMPGIAAVVVADGESVECAGCCVRGATHATWSSRGCTRTSRIRRLTSLSSCEFRGELEGKVVVSSHHAIDEVLAEGRWVVQDAWS